MLKTILTFIQYKTSWLTILGLLGAAILMMFLMNGTHLPFSTPTIEEHSGGVAILDTRASFTPDDAYELFTALGTEGRQAYLVLHLVPDTLEIAQRRMGQRLLLLEPVDNSGANPVNHRNDDRRCHYA